MRKEKGASRGDDRGSCSENPATARRPLYASSSPDAATAARVFWRFELHMAGKIGGAAAYAGTDFFLFFNPF
jgi:hypothetical protein